MPRRCGSTLRKETQAPRRPRQFDRRQSASLDCAAQAFKMGATLFTAVSRTSMRALRAYSRYWAFACALLFLPWMQLAMAGPSARQASCCESMGGMASMATTARHGTTRATARTASLATCLAMCATPSASIPSRQIPARIPRFVNSVSRVVLPLPAVVPPRAWSRARDTTKRPIKPAFLAARLQV